MNSPVLSPCIAECGLVNNICKGCHRTREELKDWRSKPVDDRMAIMEQLKGVRSTHRCPSCQEPAYCAMEAGKSASTCWCMSVTRTAPADLVEGSDACLCRKCLCQ